MLPWPLEDSIKAMLPLFTREQYGDSETVLRHRTSVLFLTIHEGFVGPAEHSVVERRLFLA